MYGKDIRIITTHPNPDYKQFVIVAGGNSQIRSSHLAAQNIYITAYDSGTFNPLTLNGMRSQSAAPVLNQSAMSFTFHPVRKFCSLICCACITLYYYVLVLMHASMFFTSILMKFQMSNENI